MIICPLTLNTAAMVLATGALIRAHVPNMPPFVHFASVMHPLRARATLGPYDGGLAAFSGCTLTMTERPHVSPANTTQFQRVLVED